MIPDTLTIPYSKIEECSLTISGKTNFGVTYLRLLIRYMYSIYEYLLKAARAC